LRRKSMHLSAKKNKLGGKALFYLSIILGILAATASQPAARENFIEVLQHGRIDWTNGFIEASGVGRPPPNPINAAHARAAAERDAGTEARSNLIALVKSIRVDSKTLAADHMAGKRIPDEILEILVRDARTVDLSYGPDDRVRVKVSIRLYGPLAERLLPRDISVIPTVMQPQDPSQKAEPFSGLLVDCRGVPLKPCLVPLIVDDEGEIVYGPAFASRDHAVERGMASYSRNIASGESHPKIGPNPLSVKGIRTVEAGPCDILISNADAAKIRRLASNLNFLHQCRVLLVTD
jgi:hypothetical protein